MSQSSGCTVQIAHTLPSYAIDQGNRCLWRDRERLDLSPKAFDVLEYLRRNPNRLVSQDEILDQVWPNRFVQPEIVKTYIRTLRRLLEDDVRRPRFIETRPRSGYRFLGELPDWQDILPAFAACKPKVLAKPAGRDAEHTVLSIALGDARSGQRECVVLTGEAGLGKSTLLDTFVATAQTEPRTVVAMAYGVPTRGLPEPFSLAITLLQDLVRQIDPLVFIAALTVHAPAWARYLAPAHLIVSNIHGSGWLPQQMVREACTLIEHFATQLTIVLAVDDLQWIDPNTADLLVTLCLRRYPARLMIVTAFRQVEFTVPCPIHEAVQGLVRQGRARELILTPLDNNNIVTLLHNQVKSAEIDEIIQYSGGNPRILQSLIASGKDGAGVKLQMGGAPLPVQRALEAGSIAGPRFCAWAVAKILGTEQDTIDDLLARIASSRQYLRLDGSYLLPDGIRTPIYAFRHAVFYRLLLDGQLPTRRSERFRKFGDAIITLWGEAVKDVANDVSRAFKSAGNWSGAIMYNQLAAQGAVERDRPVEAVRFLTEALDFSTRLPAAERFAAQTPIQQRLRRLSGLRRKGPCLGDIRPD